MWTCAETQYNAGCTATGTRPRTSCCPHLVSPLHDQLHLPGKQLQRRCSRAWRAPLLPPASRTGAVFVEHQHAAVAGAGRCGCCQRGSGAASWAQRDAVHRDDVGVDDGAANRRLLRVRCAWQAAAAAFGINRAQLPATAASSEDFSGCRVRPSTRTCEQPTCTAMYSCFIRPPRFAPGPPSAASSPAALGQPLTALSSPGTDEPPEPPNRPLSLIIVRPAPGGSCSSFTATLTPCQLALRVAAEGRVDTCC